jgi:predicted amidohydrolase YtcJ
MTTAADLLLVDGEVHTLTEPDRTASAVAIRNGRVVRVGNDYDLRFLSGVETREIELAGRVLLPGFVDAHTHLAMVGRYEVHADLRGAGSLEGCLDALRDADDGEEWVLGFGFEESGWPEDHPPTREDLDRVAADRPVAAFREDMHTAVVNSAALEALGVAAGEAGVTSANGEPTGVLREAAAERAFRAIEPDREGARELLGTAQRVAHRRGVTGVHDMVRRSSAPEAYRVMDRADELRLRVRLNYWADHLDALEDVGLVTNHGSAFVETGAVKTFTDGSIGSRTARLAEPYADGEGRGEWVVEPDRLRALLERVAADDRQLAAHAIGEAAVEAALSAIEDAGDADARHRIEHAELATADQIARMAAAGVVASVQPNFHKWAGADGLYERRLGAQRARRSNPLATLADAGVELAFGSDCMPLDPLFGVHHAVNAPAETQRLGVTEALRAYTLGSARAGFDEGRLGTVEAGTCADLVALERSPWEHAGDIADIDVALTVVDGDVVYDGREGA